MVNRTSDSLRRIVSTFEKEENLGKIVNLLKDQQVRRSVELEVGQLSYDDLNPPYTLYVRTWYFSLQNEEPVLGHHYVTFRYAFENSNIGNMIECSEYRQNDSALVVSTFHVINSKARHVLNQVAQFSKAKFNIEPKLSQWEKITNHIFWILFQIEKKIKA